MPDWPAPTRVDDRRFAHALREGDATDVAHVYSGYAALLFDYCHALLRDQDDAVAALHDTFVAAHAHVGRLTEPEYFRAWLYALARNEALLRLNDPERPVERNEAPEADNAFQDAEERNRRQEGRTLMHSALSALSGRERETIDLMLRHRLEAQDLAGIFGISGTEATELAAEARSRLDEALSAAVIARTGAQDCPSVGALMDQGGWPLTAALSRKLIRHIQNCPTCGERNQRKVSATRLIETLPVALLPADLQRTVLTTITSPDRAAVRAEIAAGAEPLDTWGWPAPVTRSGGGAGHTGTGRKVPSLWPLAAAGALVVVLVGAMLLWLPGSSDRSSAQSDPSTAAAPPDASETPEVSPSDGEIPSPEVSETPEVTESPTPSPTPTESSTPTPSPTPTKSTTPPATRKPAPGRLEIGSGGCAGRSVPSGETVSCVLSVRAVGGKVSWSVRGVSGGGGGISASGGGTLAKGTSTTVTVSITDTCTGGTGAGAAGAGAVNFSPNGTGFVTWTCVPPADPGQTVSDPSTGP